MMRLPHASTITLRVAALCIAAISLAACDSAPTDLNVGQAAPAFETFDHTGRRVRFPEDVSGRPVVIRFWADWCSVCEPEMRALDPEYRRLAATGLQLLAVNVGQDRETVSAFVARTGIGYPALLDEKLVVYRRYQVVGLPTTYFVDARGVIRGKAVGELSTKSFARQVRALSSE